MMEMFQLFFQSLVSVSFVNWRQTCMTKSYASFQCFIYFSAKL